MSKDQRDTAVKRTSPNLVHQPRPEFRKPDFDAAIWLKGYRVFIEKAIRCPCEGTAKQPLIDCTNCHGLGYFWVNAIETRALITSINRDTEQKSWSLELLGTASVSVKDDQIENLSFYDKLTFKDKRGVHNEVLTVRENLLDNTKFVFLVYRPIQILSVFVFNGSQEKLIKLNDAEYEISEDNPYVVKLNISSLPNEFNNVVSIRYRHEVQYNVIDLPHEIRASNFTDSDGKLTKQDLPVNAIVRRSHLLLGEIPEYNGSGIQNNNY